AGLRVALLVEVLDARPAAVLVDVAHDLRGALARGERDPPAAPGARHVRAGHDLLEHRPGPEWRPHPFLVGCDLTAGLDGGHALHLPRRAVAAAPRAAWPRRAGRAAPFRPGAGAAR